MSFSKPKPYGLEHIKIEFINQDELNCHNFLLKHFGNAILDNSNWDKIIEGITKKSISGTQ